MRFKRNKVWVAVDALARPVVEEGKVLIKYQLDQPHEYRVHFENLSALDKPDNDRKAQSSNLKSKSDKKTPLPKDGVIHVYTDGASSGNPGPSGIGVFLQFGEHEKEISEHIGESTNNIAELEAIRVALSEIKNPRLPVRVYTDSGYAHGLLSKGWKPKKNKRLVDSIKKLMKRFNDLKFVKVKGHAGNEGNEKADRLATQAIKRT